MLIDSHCHLDFEEFDADREQVLQVASAAGVKQIIVPAVSQAGWPRTIKVCRRHELLFALGLHPLFIDEHQPQHLSELDEQITRERPLAVGEIGLDFYSKELDKDKQIAYFTKQLIIAKRHALPAIIHCRKAHDECLTLLSEHQTVGGIIHAFNGSLQHAQKYIQMGFLLGFGGMLTYQRSSKLRRLAASLPLSAIALETDAPDMTVANHRGTRNSPAYLPQVADALADIKGTTVTEIAAVTTANVHKCLQIS